MPLRSAPVFLPMLLVTAALVGVIGCEEEPKEDPPTKDGDACGDDENCDKGFACLVLEEDEEEGTYSGECKTLPDGCSEDEPCGCDTIDSLCPPGSSGFVCISIFDKPTIDCGLGNEGEGEGEGEGE